MPVRIPKSEIEKLKRTVPLADVVGATVALAAQGKHLVGKCPFHDDDTPSLSVTPSTNLWRCFGCNSGGSAIDWVMKRDKVDFLVAASTLKAQYLPAPSTKAAEKVLSTLTSTMTEREALDVMAAYYAGCFDIFDEGRAYLRERGISEATARAHGVGFAGANLDELLRVTPERPQLRRLLQHAGIMRQSGTEHLRGCVTVPLVDENRGVVSFYGRKLENWRDAQSKHLYMPGPHRGVFNVDAFFHDDVVVCEAVIDALSFLEQSIDNVTTAYGTAGVTDEMVELLKKTGAKRVLCAFDGDDAGDAGCVALRERLPFLEVLRVPVPRGVDVNDLLQKGESLASLLLETSKCSYKPARSSPEVPPMSSTNAPLPSPSAVAGVDAAAAPVAPREGLVSVDDDEAVFAFGDRRYVVRGLARVVNAEGLKVHLVLSRRELIHPDTLDVCVAKARGSFAAGAAADVGVDAAVIKADLNKLYTLLQGLKRERRDAAKAPKVVEVEGAAREDALALLRDPNLLQRIVDDFAACGVVGEETNKVVAYLAATSRKLKKPLAVAVRSGSSAGKSSLIDAVLSFVPDEDKFVVSAMTGQALFYMESDLKHKVLSVAEEEGSKNASYSLKVLQSDGQLAIVSTVKDPVTGNLKAHEHKTEGPIAILTTTTSVEEDEELMNRCIELTVDESRQQTRRIQNVQRQLETVDGLRLLRARSELQLLHQNAQRLLRQVHIVNNLAPELDFTDARIRSRRDNAKFLTLIRAVAFLHQHQREMKRLDDGTPYIEVTRADVETAKRLAAIVFPPTHDELPPKTRELLTRICALVDERRHSGAEDVLFTVRDVREALGLGHSATAKHIKRLVELEYLEAHRSAQHSQREWFRVVDGPGAFGKPSAVSDKPSAVSGEPSAHLPHPGAEGFDVATPRKHKSNTEPSALPRQFQTHKRALGDVSGMTHPVEAAE